MLTHAYRQKKTFYEEIQNHPALDLRDNRGKKHDLALVLLGVMIGLLRHRDGNLSSIHRSMVNTHERLAKSLGIDNKPVVSRSQLPRILEKVNRKVFEELLFSHFQIELSAQEQQWFSGDGKELRGSIEKGDKRGEVVVQLVRHEDRSVLGQAFYNGTKDSEKPCLQQLIEQTGAQSQQITADALHLCPAMTEPIEAAGGVFIIGLKENQKELLQDMVDHSECFKPWRKQRKVDKGHGRLETRQYYHYDVSEEYFESRWNESGFRSLFKVERSRITLKTNEKSAETTYYISNGSTRQQRDYFAAIRNHWSVEVNNHYRDVSLKEDQFRTKKNPLQVSWQDSEHSSWSFSRYGSLTIWSQPWSDSRIILTT